MPTKKLEFRVGLFVVAGIIVLAGSVYWLERLNLRNNTRTVQVKFDDVGMLKVGNIVTVSGVYKGKVTGMELLADGVITEIILSADVVLKEDAQFVIRNFGIMGERFVAIYPGESDQPLDSTVAARGRHDSGIPEVMGLMGEMVSELHDLVISFKRTIGSDSSLARFHRSIGNLERASSSIADYLDRNEEKLDNTAENFLKASRELKNILVDNSVRVDSSMLRMDRISVRLESFVAGLDTLSASAREFADKLNNPDGSLQMFLEDGRLYNDLRKTADGIDDLVQDIRANPRKYLRLKIELF